MKKDVNMTGLQKWQMAVKFIGMNKEIDKFNYLNRYQKNGEIELNMKLTKELEVELNRKDEVVNKRDNGMKQEQARKLHYQKVKQKIHHERYQELVPRNLEIEKIAQFNKVYDKLMVDPKAEKLEEKYAGKKRLTSMPSLNSLARIQASYDETGNPIPKMKRNAS